MEINKERKQSVLSELYIHKDRFIKQFETLKIEKRKINKEMDELKGKLLDVIKQIDKIEGRDLLITTHALERYQLRVSPNATELDMRMHLCTPLLYKMIAELGATGTYPVGDIKVIVEDNKILTITLPNTNAKVIHKKSFFKQRANKKKAYFFTKDTEE